MNLLEHINYNPETGEFTWSKSFTVGGHIRIKGEQVNLHKNSKGYLKIKFCQKLYSAHVMAWKLHHGTDAPDGMYIDHKNTDKADNRIENLRLADKSQNGYNTNIRKDNQTGVKGVAQLPSGRYQLRIIVNKKRHQVGTFDTIEQAVAAADEFRKLHHGEFANNG